MKNLVFILIIMCLPLTVAGQKTESKSEISVELGYAIFDSSLNDDDFLFYSSFHNAYHGAMSPMRGMNLKFTLPTKREYLDLIFGAIYLNIEEQLDYTPTYPLYIIKSREYILNGGGIYFGVSPKLKGKHFGLTSDLALGIFPFKEYNSIVHQYSVHYPLERGDEIVMQQVRTSTFGGMASVGFYVKFGHVSINPSLNMIVAGGANASFLFYGFVLPLTIHF